MNKQNLLNKKGQTVMEYVIITGLVGVFCIYAVREFGQQIEQKVQSSIKRINRTIKIR